ncbi:MAG: ERF family protein [Candidatus Babeliaceae bacterium]|jgi:hypothetical protein
MDQFQSSDVNHIMLALMELHKEFGVVVSKDRKGHKGTYASLPCILESIHKMCSKHGLILTQASRIIDGKIALESILRHPKSGQWISCQSLLTPNTEVQSCDQAWGGSSTYHRRYDAMMLLGIFSEDDPTDHDGNIENNKDQKNSSLINEKQYALLLAKIQGNKELERKILATLKLNKLSDIPWKEFNKVLQYVENAKTI